MELDLQFALKTDNVPSEADFSVWVAAALPADSSSELSIRVVDEEESRTLNATYRHKDAPTNVLSFPFESLFGLDEDYLGDLVICAPVVEQEAQMQNKVLNAHWAHMVVHGVLHLRGYDHQNDDEAIQMENAERAILHQLHFPDPYREYALKI